MLTPLFILANTQKNDVWFEGLTPIWVTGDRVKLTLEDFSQIIKKVTAISLEVLQDVHWPKSIKLDIANISQSPPR